jgi:hypothetical protein
MVRTYKHLWLACRDCGNVFRQRRQRYPASFLLPRALRNRLPVGLPALLLPAEEIIDNESRMYAYYPEVSAAGSSVGTKWEGELDRIKATLSMHGVDLAGKTVLHLSGGPGFLVHELQNYASRAVVTEFSRESVEGMRKNLRVESLKYDYNTDDLGALFSEPFDVILIPYSINFCLDLPSFTSALSKISHRGTVVYVSFVPPTLGCCLRWQWDEYTYNALYTPDTMSKAFTGAGFTELATRSEGDYPYTADWGSGKLALIKRGIALAYLARAPRKGINRELTQKGAIQVFEATD